MAESPNQTVSGEPLDLAELRQQIVGVDALIIGSLTEFGRKTLGESGFLSDSKRQVAFAKVDLRVVDQRAQAERQRKLEEERLKQLETQRQRRLEDEARKQREALESQRAAEQERAFRAGQQATLREQYVATIAAAADSASPGDTIALAPGTYREHGIVLDMGVDLRGASGKAWERSPSATRPCCTSWRPCSAP